MPVIIREYRIISFFRDMSDSFRWIMSSAICLMIVIVWLIFFYFPSRSHLIQAGQEVALLLSQTETFKKMEIQQSVLEHECGVMCGELAKKKKVMRNHSLDFVLDKASDHGLACVALGPQSVKKYHMLETSRHEVGFKGAFQSLISYAHALDQENGCIALRRFEVLRDEDGEVRCSALFKLPHFVGDMV